MLEIIENIPVALDFEKVCQRLHVQSEEDADLVKNLLSAVKHMISARAAYRICYVEEKAEYSVSIDGMRFVSRVLRKNLQDVGRVFPYVVTIGHAFEEKMDTSDDLLEKYYLDVMANMALEEAMTALKDHLKASFAIEKIASMSPGSLTDWPIVEQKSLFSVLRGVEERVGIRLSERCLMIPRKSLSGICFPTEITFYSCQLCPRQRCESRKAKYTPDLAKSYGLLKSNQQDS